MKSFLQPLYKFHFLKRSLLLVLLLFLSSLPASLAQYKIEKLSDGPVFIVRAQKDGSVRCESTTEKEKEQYNLAKPKAFHYTIVHSLNSQSVRGLKILLRATDQLMQNKEALLAFRRAAARWERYIRTNITVVIDVDFGETLFGEPFDSPLVLGATYNPAYIATGESVSGLVGNLKSLHPGDTQLQNLYDAIPIPTPTTAGPNLGKLIGGIINLQELGYADANVDPDMDVTPFGSVAYMGFNSNYSWDYDPSDGISPGKIDFDGTVTHEIGHALGFEAIAFNSPPYGPPNNYYYPWDLFRVRPDSVEEGNLTGFSTTQRVVTPGPAATEIWSVENNITYYKGTQVFFDGLKKLEVSTATYNGSGGDGYQASHWRNDLLRPPSLGADRFIGIMDPESGFGERDTIGYNDLRMLETIGYTIDYNLQYAMIQIVADGDTIDLDKSTDTLHVGDTPVNSTGEYDFQVTDLDLNHALNYESDIIFNFAFPEGSTADAFLETPEGTISGGTSATFKFMAGNSPTPGQYFGTLRLYTNVDNKGVIEIPFVFSVGGAVAPTVVLSQDNLGDFEFNTDQGTGPISKSLNITNSGNIDLTYRLVPSLSERSNSPLLAKSSGNLEAAKSGTVLSKFLKPSLLKNSSVIYQNDFESGWGGFTASGIKSEDWQLTTLGAAALDGHSKPTSVYYGHIYGDSLRYRDTSDTMIKSQGFDLSGIPPEDEVVLTFNYYLDAEVGYDFASVLVSLDNGNTYDVVATSNNGILHNTDNWESVMIELPELSGNPDTVYLAFKFTSDDLVEGEGWFIDDVALTTVQGGNTIYTVPRSGTISGSNSQQVQMTIAGNKIATGYYQGNLSIFSNDPRNLQKIVSFTVKNFLFPDAEVNKLYASTGRGVGANGSVLSIDLKTGAGTVIGPSGFEPLKSITLNPVNNQIFAFEKLISDSASTFIRINPSDGFGLTMFKSGLTFTATVFDTDGTLYLTTNDKKLYKLDPVTGDTTFVANVGINAAALAIDPDNGDLWASVDESSQNDRLYKINKTTGDTSRVGRTGLNKKTRSLAFGPEGNLFGTTGEETQLSTLIQIDKSNAAATQIGDVGYRGVFGMAFKYDPNAVAVEEGKQLIPNQFELSQNYPNPFNPSTTIRFAIPENANVKLRVYNLLGEEITTLFNGDMSAGYHSVDWNASRNGRQLSSGVYFYSIDATGVSGKEFISTKKMILLK